MGLAEQLSEYVTDIGLEKQKLASLLGVKPSTISDYLNGRASPTAEGLIRAAETLAVSVDWLLGRPSATRWSPAIQQLRLWLHTKAPEVVASDAQSRIVMLIKLMKNEVAVCRQDWFMAGILGMDDFFYRRMMAGEKMTINEMNLGRFADFTTLPEMWLMLGDPAFLTTPTDFGDYTNVVLRFIQLGITPTELHQNMNWIQQIVDQMRRLSE